MVFILDDLALINATDSVTSYMQSMTSFMLPMIGIVMFIVITSIVIVSITSFGKSDPTDSTTTTIDKPKPDHKQTYLEYVKEMKEAEKIIAEK